MDFNLYVQVGPFRVPANFSPDGSQIVVAPVSPGGAFQPGDVLARRVQGRWKAQEGPVWVLSEKDEHGFWKKVPEGRIDP